MELKTLIAECTAYDFKVMLEEKKPKSWLKSVSSEDYFFTILANSFKDRTKQEWDKKYLLSFGLVTGTGNLTNAGALFALVI